MYERSINALPEDVAGLLVRERSYMSHGRWKSTAVRGLDLMLCLVASTRPHLLPKIRHSLLLLDSSASKSRAPNFKCHCPLDDSGEDNKARTWVVYWPTSQSDQKAQHGHLRPHSSLRYPSLPQPRIFGEHVVMS